MSLESQISALVSAAEDLTGIVNNKVSDIDQKLSEKSEEVNAYINGARLESPFFRTTENQFLNVGGDGSAIPKGFITTLDASAFSVAALIGDGSELSGDFLTSLGLSMKYPGVLATQSPRILKVSASSSGVCFAFNRTVPTLCTQFLTVGAYVKPLSEGISFFGQSAAVGEWTFVRKISSSGVQLNVDMSSIAFPETGGSFYIALPALVAGRFQVDSDSNMWGIFPGPLVSDGFEVTEESS